ncbi:MAG: helix-turn-helix domain-containing protein [Myxococcota bacterium]
MRWVRHGGRTIDLDRGTVDDRPLRPREAALLRHLADHAGEVISTERLLREVWGYHPAVRSRTVYSTMARLRIAIERDPKNPTLVVAVRRSGFRFDGQVEHATAALDIDALERRLHLAVPDPTQVVPAERYEPLAADLPSIWDAARSLADLGERARAAAMARALCTLRLDRGTPHELVGYAEAGAAWSDDPQPRSGFEVSRSRYLRQAGRLTESLQAARAAVEDAGDDPEHRYRAWRALLVSAERVGELSTVAEALDQLERVLDRLSPESRLQVGMERARSRLADGDAVGALAELDRIDADRFDARVGFRRRLLVDGYRFEVLRWVDPTSAERLGIATVRRWEQIGEAANADVTRILLADLALLRGSPSEARSWLSAVSPSNLDRRLRVGWCLAYEGAHPDSYRPEALAVWQSCEEDGDREGAAVALATVALADGLLHGPSVAAVNFREAVQIAPRSPLAAHAVHWLGLVNGAPSHPPPVGHPLDRLVEWMCAAL